MQTSRARSILKRKRSSSTEQAHALLFSWLDFRHRKPKPVPRSADSCAQYLRANRPVRSPPSQHQPPPQDGSGAEEQQRKRDEIRRGKQKAEEPSNEPPLDMDEDMDDWEERESGEGAEEAGQEESDGGDGLTKEETELLDILRGMQHRGTRFPDEETIRELGFERDMTFLFDNLGLRHLMSFRTESYREETCLFIATLKIHFYGEEEESPDDSAGYISFWCQNARHTLTMRQIDTLFRFPASRGCDVDVDKEELLQLWRSIASGEYCSSASKSAKIRSPVLRFFHKCLANTLFARKTTGNINESELALIDVALSKTPFCIREKERLMGDRNDAGITPMLLDQFMSYKPWAWSSHKRKSQSELRMGGLVTPILLACGIDLDMRKSNVAAAEAIDLANLRNSCFLARRQHNGAHVYLFEHPQSGNSKMILPQPGFTSILGGFNVNFCPPTGVLIGQANQRADNVQERPQEETAARAPSEHDAPDEFESCHFEEYRSSKKMADALDTAHKHIGLLQKWNKLQDKVIKTMRKQIKTLNDKLSCSSSGGDRAYSPYPPQPQPQRNRAPPAWEYQYPAGQPYYSDPYFGFRGIPNPPPPFIEEITDDHMEEAAREPEKARASSYEPREKKQKRLGYERSRSSTSQLGLDRPVRLVRQPIRSTNPSSGSIASDTNTPSYTREDMEKAADAFFRQP